MNSLNFLALTPRTYHLFPHRCFPPRTATKTQAVAAEVVVASVEVHQTNHYENDEARETSEIQARCEIGAFATTILPDAAKLLISSLRRPQVAAS